MSPQMITKLIVDRMEWIEKCEEKKEFSYGTTKQPTKCCWGDLCNSQEFAATGAFDKETWAQEVRQRVAKKKADARAKKKADDDAETARFKADYERRENARLEKEARENARKENERWKQSQRQEGLDAYNQNTAARTLNSFTTDLMWVVVFYQNFMILLY